MRKTRIAISTFFTTVCLFSLASDVFAADTFPVAITARRVDNGTVIPSETTMKLFAHEMIAVDYTFKAYNVEDFVMDITIRAVVSPIPPYVSGWSDTTFYLPPGDTAVVVKRIYVQPYSEHIDHPRNRFFVQIQHPRFWLPHRLTFDIRDSGLPAAELLSEPEFTSGTSNTVRWVPAQSPSVVYQDAYAYDVLDPSNLVMSLKNQFGVQLDDTMRTTFSGLEHGHTYRYFVKVQHDRAQGPISLYSRFETSRQDRMPPETVPEPLALEHDLGVELSWLAVQDTVSGVDRYVITRAADTDAESLVHTVAVTDPNTFSYGWIDTNVDSGLTYHYRVRAVDEAGNVGSGERSNAIRFGEGSDQPDIPEDPPEDVEIQPVSDPHAFIRGPVDTVRIGAIPEQVQRIRFEAVRDDPDFFADPPAGVGRYFDGGWVERPFPPYWVFDYRFSGPVTVNENGDVQYGAEGVELDANFVSGHTYYRRVTFDYVTAMRRDTAEVIPDCFPPEDIRNLELETWITDPPQPDRPGYSGWTFRLTWESAEDAASGLKRYRIFRKVNGVDDAFTQIPLSDSFVQNTYETAYTPSETDVTNPVITYKIASDDRIGNTRTIDQTVWDVSDRALNAPVIAFESGSPDLIEAGNDSAFCRSQTASIRILRFERSAVERYVLSVNGDTSERINTGQDTLTITLPDTEMVQVKIRAVYHAGRSSVWSDIMTLIRTRSDPPPHLTAANDPDSWEGHIHLSWRRPSMDAAYYEIWRDSSLIGVDSSRASVIHWTDYYAVDELTGAPAVPLTAYKTYHYQIRKVNLFGDVSGFTAPVPAVCNKPPDVVSHDPPQLNDNRYFLCVHWKRALPSLVRSGFQTRVAVYRDSLDSLITIEPVADDDTTYCYRDAEAGHNYIFRIREIPNDPAFGPSAWSRPYTVSSLNAYEPFTVLPQPNGPIYLDWEDSKDPNMVETYKIQAFRLCRDDVCWNYPNTTFSRMDPASQLVHGREYTYTLFGLDSLGQVVAAASRTAVSDTGSVFIPEIDPFEFRYFNDDSITVSWTWRDIAGNALTDTTRGAKQCLIQASVSRGFPPTPEQTIATGWFDVSFGVRNRTVPVPELLNRENENVYFRITARDAWNHPDVRVWSTEFYPLKRSIYDPVPPRAVQDLAPDNARAWYAASDTVVIDLLWTGTDVEQPEFGAQEPPDPELWNAAFYRVVRKLESGGEKQLIQIPVQSRPSEYIVSDTIPNRTLEWKVVSVDSAGNVTSGPWTANTGLVPTPKPPDPVQFRGCNIVTGPDDPPGLEYFVEIAMDPDHFVYAYEIGEGDQIDRFLCRSPWLTETAFACTTGWGAIELDTTWFRVKSRGLRGADYWESGWSDIVYYTPSGNGDPQKPADSDAALPESFSVSPNYPNPFNGFTRIDCALPEPADVEIRIFNVYGEQVRLITLPAQPAGYRSAVWDGRNASGRAAASGIYLVRIRMRSEDGNVFRARMKMTLLK